MMLEISGSKWMDETNKAIPGEYGKWVRNFGFVPLGMEDAIFKVVSYRYEIAKQAFEGKAPDHSAAIAAAKSDTFQRDIETFINLKWYRNF
jgi:hypothetical protein